MSIGGYDGDFSLDDVEITSLDPELYPVPECLMNLNTLPYPTSGPFGALDYSGKSVLKGQQSNYALFHNWGNTDNRIENNLKITTLISLKVAMFNMEAGPSTD